MVKNSLVKNLHLLGNNKNTFNAGHVLTHYLRKLLGSFHSGTKNENTQLL